MLKTARSTVDVTQITGVLPVVNGGTGVSTSTGTGNTVLSDAPTLSGNVLLSTGNITQGTAAKGVNFTANTPTATGTMTSQLLNWYEEGTWTPTIRFSGASVGITYASQAGTYTRIGRQVTLNFDVRLSNKGSSTGAWEVGGFPFAAGVPGGGNLFYQSGGALVAQLAGIRITGGSAFGGLFYASTGATLNYAETDATNTSICIGQVIFFV